MKIFDLLKNKVQKNNNLDVDKETPEDSQYKKSGIMYKILEGNLDDFFPSIGDWYSPAFKRREELNYTNMPCHLRNDKWMSLFYQDFLLRSGIVVPEKVVYDFITSSEKYKTLRHNYELKIVKWQIDWMRSGGENWLIPNGFNELSLVFSSDVDKMFRDGIVITLSAIGLDKEVIEEGIEKYSEMWRGYYMNLGFDNEFNPIVFLSENQQEPASEEHKNNWLKLREYEYYNEHKESVDNYGSITPGMKLTGEELKELRKTLTIQNYERHMYLEELNQNNINVI